jgi:hypothetical protein
MFWQGSRMAQADRAPETRVGECVRCHTTGGFLDRLGVRKLAQRMPDPTGIACAACHSPHARDARGALVRVARFDGSLEARDLGASSICMPCHGGEVPDGRLPSASAARLVFAAPRGHASDKGCLLCHSSGEKGGVGHTFKAQPATCIPCHGSKAPEAADVAARARELWTKLQGRRAVPAAMPPHASPSSPDGPLADAARKVALVIEDPAAGAHNAAYARALLQEAEKAISANPPR